jgi:hypothetical protein
MLEKIKNIINSLRIDNIVQGFLFLLLLLTFFGFIPGITLVLAPFTIISFGLKSIYDFIKNENIEFV